MLLLLLGTHNENNKPFRILPSLGTWGLGVGYVSTNKPFRGTAAFIFSVEGVGSRSLRYVGRLHTKSSFYRPTEHYSAAALSIVRQQWYYPLTGAESGNIGNYLNIPDCTASLSRRRRHDVKLQEKFNPLIPELNPICYLLALLGAHHFLHVSRIRVKLLTLRRLMSYIYIYGAPILDVSRSHTTTQHSR